MKKKIKLIYFFNFFRLLILNNLYYFLITFWLTLCQKLTVLTTMEKEKKYRPNVAAVILSNKYPFKCEIFIGNRTDIEDAWQFPQGGIDKGESAKEALFRELKEEVGTNDIEIIAEFPDWISYDFPSSVAKKMYPYSGQIQKYFLVKLKPNAKIDINTKEPEFDGYQFVSYKDIFKKIVFFKRPVYKKILEYFKKEGYL